jgi:haloacid dehalogenase superfamily, subfamily IA, variant 3 with third motif having DD or ED
LIKKVYKNNIKEYRMKISAVLFDLDGTIIDSAPNLMFSWASTLSEIGINVKPEDLKKFVGLSPKVIVSKFIPDPSDELIEKLKERRKMYFKMNIHRVKLFDDAVELLNHLNQVRIKAALATSMGRDMLIDIIQYFDLDRYLCCWVSAEDVKNPKPAPDVFLKALELTGAKKDLSLGVGDREYDIIALKKAGIKSALVKRDEFSVCSTVTPDITVNRLSELIPLIEP